MEGLRNRFRDQDWSLKIQQEVGSCSVEGELIEAEPDLLPVPSLEDGGPRSWGWFHLMGYWVAEAFGISQYQVASSAVAAGLNPGLTIAAVFIGHLIISIPNALNGWVGSNYGLNFPSFARASFGYRGVTIAIACRCVAAIVWFGTQTYQGGQCIEIMLGAIWPSFRTFPNHLPASANVTSSQLLCFFIFYFLQLPLLWIHISKLRYLFLAKVIIMPIFGITLFAWSVKEAGGFGPLWSQPTQIKASDGRPAAVVFMSSISAAIAPKATLALNIGDFTRYAKRNKDVVWTNIFSLSILVTLCAALGVVVTSSAQVIYGVSTWNPLQVSNLMGNRAARFFSAFCWSLAVIATNISANSTAVGNDLTILFPKYINIRRGQYICAIVGLASTPWNIQNSAKTFTSFLSGYSIFLAPVAAIMIADYWIVKKRHLHVAAIYKGSPASEYWYTSGFNMRAVVAFVLGTIPNLPGFVRTVGGAKMASIPRAATYISSLVWPVGFVVTAAVYLLLSKVFPPPTRGSVVDRETEESIGEEKSIEASGSENEKKV